MALGYTLPYGLRDVRVTPLGADGATLGTAVDLPIAQTFSFSETEEFEDLRGDDSLVATRGAGPIVEWEIESGGISLEAYAVIAGGTVTTTGVTPNQIKTYNKAGTDARPYFKVEGQAISDNGGDFHCVVHKCKATGSLEGEMADGTFWLTKCSGKSLPSTTPATTGKLYTFVQNETTTAIP